MMYIHEFYIVEPVPEWGRAVRRNFYAVAKRKPESIGLIIYMKYPPVVFSLIFDNNNKY